ncbi:MAG: Tetratricopeptide 2 repeat-containing protein [Bacteroidota bacterium]|nr:Tetratricopeptide 2 repeat-containing protein [Bacteroidota bacterium]
MKYLLIFTFLFSALLRLSAQKATDERLAMQYYNEKQYDKAIVYYEKLYDKLPDAYFVYYFNCLLATKDYKTAEKITKRHLKHSATNAHLYVKLGLVYKLMGNPDKEKDQYDKAVKEVIPEQSTIFALAHSFEEVELYDYAIEVYLKGRKATPETYPYYYEVADLYKKKGDLRAMVNEYLNAIEFRESELYTAQANLQQSLGYDDKNGGFNNPILKEELQKRIQQKADKTVFSEFLIFILNQQKDFNASFVQSKALDKRQKGDGTRLMELAKLSISNSNYEVADRCYQYVISKGKENPYYDLANIERLNANYLQLTAQPNPPVTDASALNANMKSAIETYGISNLTFPLIKKSALIKAYYLNQPGDAIQSLEEVMAQYTFDKNLMAELKLDLGDMHLLMGNIWDASLLYSQVEKDFKYEPVGQGAKFKNAKLSYYASDFKWAKAQCDVLKGATTKTIANDALDLSLIISDAIGIDTNAAPLSMFSSAELLILQHQYDRAIARLDSINLVFSEHTLGDDIYYKKAEIFKLTNRYADAAKMYENILEFYPTELYGDDALFKEADLYDRYLADSEKAKQLYQDMLVKYPGSIYVVEARKRYRELRGDSIN